MTMKTKKQKLPDLRIMQMTRKVHGSKTKKQKLPDLRIMQMTRKVHGSKRKGRNTSNLYFAKLLCALAIVTGCVSDAGDVTTGEYVVETCGEAPQTPGRSYAFEQVNGYDRVLMTTSTHAALEQYIDDIQAWKHCVVGLP